MQLSIGPFFLISHSDSSLFVNRNATGLCLLILYPKTLPNSLTSSDNSYECLQDFLCMTS